MIWQCFGIVDGPGLNEHTRPAKYSEYVESFRLTDGTHLLDFNPIADYQYYFFNDMNKLVGGRIRSNYKVKRGLLPENSHEGLRMKTTKPGKKRDLNDEEVHCNYGKW